MSTPHSIFAPSSMHRLAKCTGSFDLCQLYPEPEDSPPAMEGTAFHDVCAGLIRGTPLALGSITPNGIAVTEEMIEGAEMCVEAIPEEWLSAVHVEETVSISGIHEECFGTPDAWYYDPVKKVLHVYDWKFGHGYVDEFENYQLAAYASGVIDMYGYDDQEIWVALTIGQPRCFNGSGPIRTWGCKAHELRGLRNEMAHACGTAATGQGVCRVGAHCNHCPASHACPALQAATQAAFDFTARPVPSEMSPEAKGLYLARLRQAAVLVKAMQSGLEEEVERSIRSGTAVPGFNIEPGQSKTEWSKPMNEVVALGDMLGVDLRKPKLLTPTQAVAAFKKVGLDETVMFNYSIKTPGALKLVPTDSSRTRRVFGLNKEQ